MECLGNALYLTTTRRSRISCGRARALHCDLETHLLLSQVPPSGSLHPLEHILLWTGELLVATLASRAILSSGAWIDQSHPLTLLDSLNLVRIHAQTRLDGLWTHVGIASPSSKLLLSSGVVHSTSHIVLVLRVEARTVSVLIHYLLVVLSLHVGIKLIDTISWSTVLLLAGTKVVLVPGASVRVVWIGELLLPRILALGLGWRPQRVLSLQLQVTSLRLDGCRIGLGHLLRISHGKTRSRVHRSRSLNWELRAVGKLIEVHPTHLKHPIVELHLLLTRRRKDPDKAGANHGIKLVSLLLQSLSLEFLLLLGWSRLFVLPPTEKVSPFLFELLLSLRAEIEHGYGLVDQVVLHLLV